MKTITTPYTMECTFTKTAHMLAYGRAKHPEMSREQLMREYGRPREVELILLVRWENGKVYCKINCPINPMPTNEEFAPVSLSVMYHFLHEHGWTFKSKLYTAILK